VLHEADGVPSPRASAMGEGKETLKPTIGVSVRTR
jgi:hypothetical protein